MANRAPYGRPRRRIERIVAQIHHDSQAAVVTTPIYEAEDPVTLIRTIVQLDLVKVAIGIKRVGIQLELQPKGVDVIGMSFGEISPGTARSTGFLLQEFHSGLADGPNASTVHEVRIDNRGQRKMGAGDRIVLKDITNVNGDYVVAGTVTLFFKE